MHVPPEHWSVVQGLPSSQAIGAPEQVPPLQASPIVHGLSSLQLAELGALAHDPPEQESVVQGLPSPQSLGPPAWQFPPLQKSPTVHPFPSLQLPDVGLCPHPELAEQ